MVDLFKSVFDEEMFADLYYVDENPGIVKTINVYKLDGHVHADEETKEFSLNSLSGERQKFELMHNFFVSLNFQWHPVRTKYFTGGWIARLFGRRNPRRIQELITSFDWVIATQDVIDELRQLPDLKDADLSATEEGIEIVPVHVLMGTTVYRIPEEIALSHGCSGTIYAGQRRSITPVVHRSESMYRFHFNESPDIKKFVLV